MSVIATNDPIITVARTQIRAIHSIELNGDTHQLGEHRDFRRHDGLAAFLPEQGRPSFAWVRLHDGEELTNHQHPIKSMIIVCHGSVELTGEKQLLLKEGDIVCIDANSVHGFKTEKGQVFHGLSIQFEGKGLYEDDHISRVEFSQQLNSLTALEQLNMKLSEQHTNNALFKLFASGRLQREPQLCNRFIDALYVWSHYFQRMIQARQAACTNEYLQSIYREHFREEIDHDLILRDQFKLGSAIYDPALESACNWFLSQMYQQDEAQKIVTIHLVVESSGHSFGEASAEIFKQAETTDYYFNLHASVDGDHTMIGRQYLSTLSTPVINDLLDTCRQAWQQMDFVHECIAQWTLAQD